MSETRPLAAYKDLSDDDKKLLDMICRQTSQLPMLPLFDPTVADEVGVPRVLRAMSSASISKASPIWVPLPCNLRAYSISTCS